MSNKTNLYINCEKCNVKTIRTGHRQKYCLPCAKIMQKVHTEQWYKKRKENPDEWKRQQQKYHIKSNYDLTVEQWQQMFDSQSGCCSICGIHQSEIERKLDVEHNHNTGKVRSLACTTCNKLIDIYETKFYGLEDKIKQYLERTND